MFVFVDVVETAPWKRTKPLSSFTETTRAPKPAVVHPFRGVMVVRPAEDSANDTPSREVNAVGFWREPVGE
jgi:hypothetical protein